MNALKCRTLASMALEQLCLSNILHATDTIRINIKKSVVHHEYTNYGDSMAIRSLEN